MTLLAKALSFDGYEMKKEQEPENIIKVEKRYPAEPSRDSSENTFLPAFEAKKIAANSPIQMLIYIFCPCSSFGGRVFKIIKQKIPVVFYYNRDS